MKLPIKEREFSTVIIILAVIVVIVLGVLQYRWSNQVSEATSIRLADSLQMSMINWHLDFFRVFSEICVALRVDPESSTRRTGTSMREDSRTGKRRRRIRISFPGFTSCGSTSLPPRRCCALLRFRRSVSSRADWPANFAGLREEFAGVRFQTRRRRVAWLIRRNEYRSGAGCESPSSRTVFIPAGRWRAGSSSRKSLRWSGP